MSFDKPVGLSMLLAATLIFVYYTVWTFVLPFLEPDNFLQNLFLPREYAIKIPVLLLCIGVTFVGAFIGSVLIRSSKKGKKA
ncbi:putative membrane protein [Ogataea parapolymorpha DL-1]|uniref:Dolichol phosphate-mannose biosynthesis regulatory protein n=1 Tax=Ogataea parapolymorpha (strain ATCC 26012 / BCRC 20466 / JCM 22074 / NRRL Y-7560 / DL-1) TaxID=871575 RepID=W1Q7D7_OGAPD|nr:putative membrane protein [Ogataea parapolymorpha DL-1]ESW95806.1 putative membrane protein [Ogataea parapolymorpha DL-1]